MCMMCMTMCRGRPSEKPWESSNGHDVHDVHGLRAYSKYPTFISSRITLARTCVPHAHHAHHAQANSHAGFRKSRHAHSHAHHAHRREGVFIMGNKNNSLRQTMPTVAAWIDDLREAFGAEAINRAIKNGMGGGTDFWASENGIEIGNRSPDDGRGVTADKMELNPKKYPLPGEERASRGGRGRA